MNNTALNPNTALSKVKCYNCNEKQKPNVNKINNKTAEPTVDPVKDVKLNGIETAAYIDSGSSYCLIRKSFAENIAEYSECKFILKGFVGTKKIKIF